MKQYVEIISYETGEVIKRIDVTGNGERMIDRIDNGMNRNLNHEEYYTVVSSYEDAQPLEPATTPQGDKE